MQLWRERDGMLPILLATMMTVGGFSYEIVTLSDRTKSVSSAPDGYPASWHEHVEVIVGTAPKDREFSAAMRQQAIEFQQNYYRDEHPSSFETSDIAGSMEVSERVTAASPDIISVLIEVSFYNFGASHPNIDDRRNLIWSRRLNRLLMQNDVFTVPPDRALRRIALSRFNNRDGLQNPDDPDGIPLSWDHASIGPEGITWSFGPYELGGYNSSGDATIPWSALKPYLRHGLAFAVEAIQAAPN